MDSVAEVLSVEEDFKEDEIVEFSGHTVEQAIRTHAPYASTNTHSVLRLPTEVYTYRSATSSRIRSKRRICSKRNPAAGTFEDYRSPLEEIRIKVFTSTTSGTVNLNLEQGPLKVLLVEDNKFTREAIKIQLSKETGCEPDLARDGSEALEVFSSYANQGHMYFIIFMDVVMPKMDGYQATSAIRRLEQEKGYRRTYICGMSGTQEQTEEKYKAAGMNFFVKKPLQETQIMQIFEDARNAGKIAI